MSEMINLRKNNIGNYKLMQHAFLCKHICAHCFD